MTLSGWGRLNRAKSAPIPHNGIALVDIGSIKEIAIIGFLVPGKIKTVENICNLKTLLHFCVPVSEEKSRWAKFIISGCMSI